MSEVRIKDLAGGEAQATAAVGRLFPWWVYVVPLAVALFGVGLTLMSPETNSATQAGVQMELPDFLGNYIGMDQEISLAEKKILPGDTEFVRKTYHHPKGDRILCSIVLAGGEKRSIHRPEVCLPGQGWTIRGGTIRPVTLENGREINVMDLSLSREIEVGPGQTRVIRSHYFYFFIGKGIVTPRHWKRVFLTSWDRVVRGLNHRWAYVIVSSTVTEGITRNGKNDEETIEMLKEFTSKIGPYILQSEE